MAIPGDHQKEKAASRRSAGVAALFLNSPTKASF